MTDWRVVLLIFPATNYLNPFCRNFSMSIQLKEFLRNVSETPTNWFLICMLAFRSLIHFEFIIVYGVRKCSSFILLQVVCQFSQHRLLEIVFNTLYILVSFVKDKVSIGAWIYLWTFYFVPLIYMSVFVPVPYCLDDCGFVVELVFYALLNRINICFNLTIIFLFLYSQQLGW